MRHTPTNALKIGQTRRGHLPSEENGVTTTQRGAVSPRPGENPRDGPHFPAALLLGIQRPSGNIFRSEPISDDFGRDAKRERLRNAITAVNYMTRVALVINRTAFEPASKFFCVVF